MRRAGQWRISNGLLVPPYGQRMNILVVDQFSEMGGAQRGLVDVLRAVESRGWKSHVLVPAGGPLIDELRARNIPVDEIPCGPYRAGSKSAADVLRFARDKRGQERIIAALLASGRFDLIYVNGPRVLPAASAAVGRRIPVLFHLHSHIAQASARRLLLASARRADITLAACSRSAAESAAGMVPAERSFVIFNGIEEIPFRARTFDAPWTIGMVGRISPEKGQLEFVHMAALLRRELPGARFVLCGAPLFATDRYFEQVRKAARGLPVDFLGWREDVASVYDELDLLVMPSKQEAMGRVIVEAFSAGVPVIAFPVGGIPEVIQDQETGFLAAPQTPDALAAKVRELSTGDRVRLQGVAWRARQAWQDHYTLAAYQGRITDLMERVVSGRPAGAETTAQQARK